MCPCAASRARWGRATHLDRLSLSMGMVRTARRPCLSIRSKMDATPGTRSRHHRPWPPAARPVEASCFAALMPSNYPVPAPRSIVVTTYFAVALSRSGETAPRQGRRSRRGGSGSAQVRCDPGATLTSCLRPGQGPRSGFRPETKLSISRRVSMLKDEFCPPISVDNGWCSTEKRLMGMSGGERGGDLPLLQGCSGLHRCIMFHCCGSSSRGFFGSYRSSLWQTTAREKKDEHALE